VISLQMRHKVQYWRLLIFENVPMGYDVPMGLRSSVESNRSRGILEQAWRSEGHMAE
jgi:hypothetical protein